MIRTGHKEFRSDRDYFILYAKMHMQFLLSLVLRKVSNCRNVIRTCFGISISYKMLNPSADGQHDVRKLDG